MSIIVAERHFSVCRWLSKLYYSILQRKSFKRLELENCAEKLGKTDQILIQRKLERSGSICFNNTSNRTMHLKNLEKKVNPHLLIIVNHLSNDISSSNHVRKPLIKFIGARLPQPHYDRSTLPPLVYESKSSSKSQGLLSSSNVPSSAVQTKIKQGTLIDDLQLPVSLRRKLISEEECNVINSGGAYGLESTSKDNR